MPRSRRKSQRNHWMKMNPCSTKILILYNMKLSILIPDAIAFIKDVNFLFYFPYPARSLEKNMLQFIEGFCVCTKHLNVLLYTEIVEFILEAITLLTTLLMLVIAFLDSECCGFAIYLPSIAFDYQTKSNPIVR